MKCIYCLEDRPTTCFKKTEHVLPQSFGRFKNNFTLKDYVCDSCNEHFGNHLEISLGRDTFEGMARFEHKLKPLNEFKSPGKNGRLSFKIAEGPLKGAYAYKEYSFENGRINIKPIPQMGFKKIGDTGYEYFRLGQIPEKEFLETNFDLGAPKSMIALGCDAAEAHKHLAEKDISFKPDGGFCPIESELGWNCEVSGVIDQVIFRSIAKIAFNYLAYWNGIELVLSSPFNPIRRYIRHGEKASWPFVVILEKAILGDEPVEGKRRLGHLITLDWAVNKLSIVSQVSLMNLMTYSVLLAKEYQGRWFDIRRGHFFNIANNEIIELMPGDERNIQ